MRPHLTLFLLVFTYFLQAQTPDPAFVSPRLLDRLEAAPESYHDIYVLLADRVDTEALLHQFQQERRPLAERSSYVITALQAKANATQTPVLQLMENHPGILEGSLKSLWITNMIVATATADLIAELSRHPAVELVELDVPFELDEMIFEGPAPPVSPNGIEPGLAAINAPFMWGLGYTGYGTIAFTSDTGVDPDHPALFTKYRGLYTPASEAFLGGIAGLPYDCGDHGTHVTGTMLGLHRNNNDTIGVAFNAQWIGSPSICGNGTSTMEAFQWALNPDGDINTTDDMPAVINNSWYDPGADNECTGGFVSIFNALEAAGVAVVFSAGNAGPGVSTITSPKNINTDLVNVFCVGNLNGNSPSLTIANSSSRGPSTCGDTGSLYIKPEVSAPGTSVRSSVTGGGYSNFSGTSMAAPHASGAILLLKEAFPEASGTDIKLALYFSATDLGDPGEDNTYGMGIINLEAAYYYMIDEGFTPSDPIVANDLLIYDIDAADVYCNGIELQPTIRVENSGTEVIKSFKVAFWIEGQVVNEYEWSGQLLPTERLALTLPGAPLMDASGANWLWAEILEVNGQEDDRALNNRLRVLTESIDKDAVAPYSIETVTGSFCEGTTAFLRAEGEGPGIPTFSWYDVAEGGDPIAVGDVFETPLLTGPATYYVEASYLASIGKSDPLAGDFDYFDLGDGNGIRFDALVDCVIRSAVVNPAATGPRIVELRDGGDNLILTKFVIIEETGPQRIDLDINVPAGDNLRLIIGAGLPFSHSTSDFDFPYELENFFIIERSMTAFGSTDQIYSSFYDLEVEFEDPCSRSPIEVVPEGTGMAPDALFSLANPTVEVDEPVDLTNETFDGSEWLWIFDDGTSSTDFEPLHSFNEPGIYTISLSATNSAGCTAGYSLDVEVIEATVTSTSENLFSQTSVLVYPNPASDQLWVELPVVPANEVFCRIYDAAGTVVQESTFGGQLGDISTSRLAPGFYLLDLITDDQRYTAKFLINR